MPPQPDMSGAGQTNGRWLELARMRVPVRKAAVWRAMLDKTEHPERYNPRIARADLLDHDPTVVLRRTWPAKGEPFAEYVRHQLRAHRVEYQRYGLTWSTAQAIVDTESGPCLVYEVYQADLARAHAGIDEAHAERTLRELLAASVHGGGGAPRPDGDHHAPSDGLGMNSRGGSNGRNGSNGATDTPLGA